MTIPAPAHEILTLIRVTETGRADATAYETIFGHNEAKLTEPITEMTVDEVQKWQPGFTKCVRLISAPAPISSCSRP